MRLAVVVLCVAALAAALSFVAFGRRLASGSHSLSAATSSRVLSRPPTTSDAAASSAVATNAAASLAASTAVEPTSSPAGPVALETTGPTHPGPKAAPGNAKAKTASGAAKRGAAKAGRKAAPRAVKPRPAASTARSLDAYRGLGSWVDIYDDRAWTDPAATVADTARHGVRTLFLETSNAKSSFALKDPAALRTFITQAHAKHMLVVAWYRPDIGSGSVDYARVVQAIRFRTADGQKFDSFALDIETSSIGSLSDRNRALEALSAKIRSLVGRSYPLGAIIPSPTGLAKRGSYWSVFPYTMLARIYDVFVPMSYYTYHGSGADAAYADTISNVHILRAQKGCSKTPIHLIGGISENSSTAETQAFVRAERGTGCIGASLYGWAGTTAGEWKALRVVGR